MDELGIEIDAFVFDSLINVGSMTKVANLQKRKFIPGV